MALADLLFGRGRPPGQSSRRKDRGGASTTKSSRNTADTDPVTPDVEEIRQRRTAYYDRSPGHTQPHASYRSQIRRVPARNSAASAEASMVVTSRQPKATKKPTKTLATRRPKPSRAERWLDEVVVNADEFVYPRGSPNRPTTSHPFDAEIVYSAHDGRSSTSRLARQTLRKQDSMSAINEAEVAPDDSISQVGRRAKQHKASTKRLLKPTSSRRSAISSHPPSTRSTKPPQHSMLSILARSKKTPTASVTTPASQHRSRTSATKTVQLVDCLTCGSDDVPIKKSAKLECGHRMCRDCLKRVFELSVKDPAHMPPRCCTSKHIPLKHVDRLFDTSFKVLWNRKYQEYHTKDRIYCPIVKCGEWIKPAHIHKEGERKYAQCPRCKTKVCTLCNNRMHKSRDCPKDPEILKLVAQAKDQGWQRCFQCHAMVEKKEGCNHMTCRCNAQFCMLCGSKWKTCDCAWFDYAGLPNPDRLNDMRVPDPLHVILRQAFRAVVEEQPNAGVAPAHRPGTRGNGNATYRHELETRRRQERLDADLARRLQLASIFETDDEAPPRPANRNATLEDDGFGNGATHMMNENFIHNLNTPALEAVGEARLGRRGERTAARRRRSAINEDDPGLVHNFLGDASVLGTDRQGA